MKRAKKGFAAFLKRRYGDRSTPKHYLSDLKQFIQQIGNKPPESVTIQDIDQFIDKQQQRGLVMYLKNADK